MWITHLSNGRLWGTSGQNLNAQVHIMGNGSFRGIHISMWVQSTIILKPFNHSTLIHEHPISTYTKWGTLPPPYLMVLYLFSEIHAQILSSRPLSEFCSSVADRYLYIVQMHFTNLKEITVTKRQKGVRGWQWDLSKALAMWEFIQLLFKSCRFVSASAHWIRLAPEAQFFSSVLPDSVHWPLEYQGMFFKVHAVSQACLLHYSLFVQGGDAEVGSLLALTYEQRLHYETRAVCSP